MGAAAAARGRRGASPAARGARRAPSPGSTPAPPPLLLSCRRRAAALVLSITGISIPCTVAKWTSVSCWWQRWKGLLFVVRPAAFSPVLLDIAPPHTRESSPFCVAFLLSNSAGRAVVGRQTARPGVFFLWLSFVRGHVSDAAGATAPWDEGAAVWLREQSEGRCLRAVSGGWLRLGSPPRLRAVCGGRPVCGARQRRRGGCRRGIAPPRLGATFVESCPQHRPRLPCPAPV
jgi:hypothetical protein